MFNRTDYVAATGSFTIAIESESGQRKYLTRDSLLPASFGILESEFYPNENNWVSIETDAACGHTGYSNAVSYAYYPPVPPPVVSCLQAMAGSRSNFGAGGTSNLTLTGISNCAAGTKYNAYYLRVGTSTPVKLNVLPVSIPSIALPNQPAGTGHGRYWIKPVDPVTLQEGASSPQSVIDGRNSFPQGGAGGPGGTPSVNAQYVHVDHLGSTRLMTDEKGAVIGRWKYFPFGQEAETVTGDDARHKFTGHERDAGVGLDYMLARSYVPSLARFMSADPSGFGVSRAIPSTWNRFWYTRSNAVARVDPDGRTDVFIGGAGDKKTQIVRSYYEWLRGSATGRTMEYFSHTQVKQAIAFLKKHQNNGEPTNIVAHSWGASAALRVAAGFGGRVDTLVGVDPVGYPFTFGTGKRPKNVATVVAVNATPTNVDFSDFIEWFGRFVFMGGRPAAFRGQADLTINVSASHGQFELAYTAVGSEGQSAADVVASSYQAASSLPRSQVRVIQYGINGLFEGFGEPTLYIEGICQNCGK